MTKLEESNVKSKKKIQSLKDNVKLFTHQLKDEKKKSRLAIAKLMEDAEVSMNDVHDLALSLARKEKDLEDHRAASKQQERDQRAASKEREREAVREERSWSARVLDKCKFTFQGVLVLVYTYLTNVFIFPKSIFSKKE